MRESNVAAVRLMTMSLLVITALGCGSSDDLDSPTAKRLRAVAALYLDYAVAKGAGPANRDELLAHVGQQPEFVLQSYGVELQDPAHLLQSERDGQALKINFGVSISGIGSQRGPILVYEATGKNGRRLVAFQDMTVKSLSEEEFAQAIRGR